MSLSRAQVVRLVAPLAVAAGVTAGPALAQPAPAAEPTLQPGVVSGNVNPYRVKRGDYMNRLGVMFKCNPVRITKPSQRELADGMEVGETIYVDQRRVTPLFAPTTHGIVLNLPEAHVYLVDRGRLVSDYPVGVSTSDKKAPIGRTRVVSMTRHPTWYVPKSIQKEMADAGREVKTSVPPGPLNPLGTRWIGFSDGSFGFHGTTSPWSIKRYASHGCVRFLRDDIEDLYERVYLGMPVRVIYQPALLAVDRRSVWISIYPDYYGLGYDYRGVLKGLAKKAGVLDRLHWPAVEKALRDKDGILVDVGQPLAPTKPLILATPKPSPLPSRTPRPQPTPKATPLVTPEPTPEASETPAITVTPTPTPTPMPASPSPELQRPPGFPPPISQ